MAIENLVLFGTTAPEPAQRPSWGLGRSKVIVTQPGCDTAGERVCRIKIVIAGYTYPFVSTIAAGSPAISVVVPSELPR